MSKIITYYSYKGGVGRSMALANTAVCLSRWGYKVLMIDWDLEAPGLEHYFTDYNHVKRTESMPGVIDILNHFKTRDRNNLAWQDCIIPLSVDKESEVLHLITSGKESDSYSKRISDFDVSEFYEKYDGGDKIETFRNELKLAYDFILIDSRTGLTDFGGVCTIHFPDILLLFYTPSIQSLKGIKNVARRAVKGQMNIFYDREKLITVPIPTRIDTQTEYKITQSWMNRFVNETKGLIIDWIPTSVSIKEFIEQIKIPYIPYFSYGEQLAVVKQGTSDPTGIGYAYENISSLLANNFEDIKVFISNRGEYLQSAKTILSIQEEKDFQIYMLYSVKDYKKFAGLKHQISVFESMFNLNVWENSFYKSTRHIHEKSRNVILSSDMFIIFLTKDLVESKYVEDELNSILTLKDEATIISILIEDVDLSNFYFSDFKVLPDNKIPFLESPDKSKIYRSTIDSIENIIRNEVKKKDEKNKKNDSIISLDIEYELALIKDLITMGKIEESLSVLSKILKNRKNLEKHYKDFILVSSQYNQAKELEVKGAISTADIQFINSRVVRSLLDIVYSIV